MAWSCVDCGVAVDCHVDPITGDESEPLCYFCAEHRDDERARVRKRFQQLLAEKYPDHPWVKIWARQETENGRSHSERAD